MLIGLVLSLVSGAAWAENFSVGSIEVGSPWTRATPRGAPVAAAYMAITNNGSTADRLLIGSTNVAGRFEIHSMVTEDGVAKMRPVTGGLEIKPGSTVKLEPGSLHVMLIGLKQPIAVGARVTGTLIFERAGKLDVEFAVQPVGGPAPAAGAHTGH
jgi:periplasmic copper chaperone A